MISLKRVLAMVLKECTQLSRDASMIMIGLLLPTALILLFGFGLSMDVKHVPVALVLKSHSPTAEALAVRLAASDYFRLQSTPTRQAAEQLLHEHKVSAIIEVPATFDRDAQEANAALGLTIHAVDANQATMVRTYLYAVLTTTLNKMSTTGSAAEAFPTMGERAQSAQAPTLQLSTRAWFNEANTSTWYLVPGLLVVTMTLVGSFLTALVIAREWERGTMESLLASPLKPLELFLGKFIPNYAIAALGTSIALLIALLLFELPMAGSIAWLAVTMLVYQALCCTFGLFLSATFKRQFLAMQYAVIGSFLPSLMLSGFLFDLRSVPPWISAIGHVLPPTYAMESLKICFLSGGVEDVLLRNLIIIVLWLAFFTTLTLSALSRTLDGEAA